MHWTIKWIIEYVRDCFVYVVGGIALLLICVMELNVGQVFLAVFFTLLATVGLHALLTKWFKL